MVAAAAEAKAKAAAEALTRAAATTAAESAAAKQRADAAAAAERSRAEEALARAQLAEKRLAVLSSRSETEAQKARRLPESGAEMGAAVQRAGGHLVEAASLPPPLQQLRMLLDDKSTPVASLCAAMGNFSPAERAKVRRLLVPGLTRHPGHLGLRLSGD